MRISRVRKTKIKQILKTMNIILKRTLWAVATILLPTLAVAQSNVIDKIVAKVGNEYILKSEIETMYMQQTQGTYNNNADMRAEILEQLLIQKLLCAEATLDSIDVEVSEVDVQMAIQQRIDEMISTIGSQERLEQYFGQSLDEIIEDMIPSYRTMLIAQRMQSKIQENIRVTPAEVRAFYKEIPKDSLIEIPAKYVLQQIVVQPTISEGEKERCRSRLREFRDRISSGSSSFSTLAVLYSEDPGTAPRGGDLGYFGRAEMTKEFSEAAFNLKGDKISKIVETEYGFHIIQLIDRKGDKISARHILLIPQPSAEDKDEAIKRLDTIRTMIMNNEVTFDEAARYFSTDKSTRSNGGLIMDMQTADIRLPRTSISGEMARVVNGLNVGEISTPFIDYDARGREQLKIVKVKEYYPSHMANLEEDWNIFENMVLREKEQKTMVRWVEEKQKNTYISIDDEYKNANFHYDGWVK